jgi:hypothetical protein
MVSSKVINCAKPSFTKGAAIFAANIIVVAIAIV